MERQEYSSAYENSIRYLREEEMSRDPKEDGRTGGETWETPET
jgi:hypothetical protein